MTDSPIEKLHRIREHVERRGRARDKDAAHSPAGRAEHHLTGVWWFTLQFVDACHWVWYWFLRPFARAFRWLAIKTWRGYRRLWDAVVYKRDAYGVDVFHKLRAGILLAATAVFVYFVVFSAATLAWDSALYLVTGRSDEIIYTRTVQEIDEDKHIVRACEERTCEEEEVLYFRIEDSLFNELWSLWNRGGFFWPDIVAGTIAPTETMVCRTTTYGFRFKMFIHRMQIYPKLLRASECEPLNTARQP